MDATYSVSVTREQVEPARKMKEPKRKKGGAKACGKKGGGTGKKRKRGGGLRKKQKG